MPTVTGFGPLLRDWRVTRQMSQQDLAERAEVSARHISFMENGRSGPSREMVLVLANALDLPLRDRNTLLGAAGFAAVYRETSLESPAMAHIRRALDHMLRTHEPYGAVVVDRVWNVVRMNEGARRMLGFFVDPSAVDPEVLGNALLAVFHPGGLRQFIVGWDALANVLVARLHRETLGPGGDETRALLDRLLSCPGVPRKLAQPDLAAELDVVIPVHLRKGDLDVRLFTTITSLGTPLDVTAQEIRIESYFPADDATEAWIRTLAD